MAMEATNVKKIRIHDLRHSYASRMLSNYNIAFVSKQLGHANISTTLDTYVGLLSEIEEKEKYRIINE